MNHLELAGADATVKSTSQDEAIFSVIVLA